MSKYNFFMRRFGTSDDDNQPIINLEEDFPGLRYKEAKGLMTKGKPKNIYFEEYADSNKIRAYIPDVICRESTEITMTFLFVGENRRKAYDDFYNYVSQGAVWYWDDARNKKVALILNAAVEPSDDIMKGSDLYIEADFVFKNIYGRTFNLCEIVDE